MENDPDKAKGFTANIVWIDEPNVDWAIDEEQHRKAFPILYTTRDDKDLGE